MSPTPGPWAFDGLRVFAPALEEPRVTFADGSYLETGLIALVYSCGDGSSAANGPLIAAAPELVGCCRELLAVLDRHLDPDSLAAVVARIRAVVAHVEDGTRAMTP
jgi:hypothetical protein